MNITLQMLSCSSKWDPDLHYVFILLLQMKYDPFQYGKQQEITMVLERRL